MFHRLASAVAVDTVTPADNMKPVPLSSYSAMEGRHRWSEAAARSLCVASTTRLARRQQPPLPYAEFGPTGPGPDRNAASNRRGSALAPGAARGLA